MRDAAYFNLSGKYRVQSKKEPEYGCLRGHIIRSAPGLLCAEGVNTHLQRHLQWNGRSRVTLRPVLVEYRGGVFDRHSDALYYRENFVEIQSEPSIDHDLLDVTKLQLLQRRRFDFLRDIFDGEAFDWLNSTLQPLERSAINEYMCHEAGHRLGLAIDDKIHQGFFRWGGKLRWPLIYVEEYRADVNSWDIARRSLDPIGAAGAIIFTIFHRFGLAAENIRTGQPGAGYIPFFHFANLINAGFLQVRHQAEKQTLQIQANDVEAVLAAADKIIRNVAADMNEKEAANPTCDVSAEAMLEYASLRIRDDMLAKSFLRVIGGANQPESGCAIST